MIKISVLHMEVILVNLTQNELRLHFENHK